MGSGSILTEKSIINIKILFSEKEYFIEWGKILCHPTCVLVGQLDKTNHTIHLNFYDKLFDYVYGYIMNGTRIDAFKIGDILGFPAHQVYQNIQTLGFVDNDIFEPSTINCISDEPCPRSG
jgi:hypothetical protein